MTALPGERGAAVPGAPRTMPPRGAGPNGAAPDRAGPDRAGPDRAGPDRMAPRDAPTSTAAVSPPPVTFPLDVDPPRERSRLRLTRSQIWLLSTAVVLIFVSIMAPYRETVDEVHVVLPMLLMILLASSVGGERLGFFLAAIGFVAIDTIFQRPFGTFSLRKPHDMTVLVSFFVTAAVSTRLLSRAQFQASEARRRSAELQRMADLGAEMLTADSTTAALERVAQSMCDILGARRCRITRGADVEGQSVVAEVRVAPASDGAASAQATAPLRFPLHADGVLIGEMHVDGVDPDAYARTRASTLQALAQYAALGLDRMQLAANAAYADSLREADRMKDMVLASVSHDLRTPLTTIKLLAASLAREGEGAAQQIEEEADRLSRMVGDLLDLSRARAGELTLAMDVNTLEDLVGAATRQMAPVLGERRVTRTVIDDEGPLVGRFDFVASLRVVVNLLENAAKYSGPVAPIELVARREGGELAIEVLDRGPGIAEDDLARIYIPFFRSEAVLYDVGGAGLGLPMAKMLAEAQGGSLRYRPRPGGGSIFTFTLPAHDESFEPGLDDHAAQTD